MASGSTNRPCVIPSGAAFQAERGISQATILREIPRYRIEPTLIRVEAPAWFADIMLNEMETLRTKLIASCGLALLLAASAVAQSAAPTSPATTSATAVAAASTPAAQQSPNTPPASGTPAGQEQKPADPNASGGDNNIPTIVTRTNEVNVVFTVTDKHGKRITDMKQGDFHVLDDNKPPELIRSFNSETNLPLQVGLLIDASNSVRDRFKFEQESAIEFLNQTIRPRFDQAFVVGFDVTPEITQDFTDNTELLAHGVHELRPGGGTALYDALYFACRDKLMKAPKSTTVRRAIILLSDGDDNQSHVTREEAIEMAQRAEAIVYTISTNVSGTSGPGDKVLDRIADATGGKPFHPFQIRDVANAFAEIQDELRSQYAISYKPADLKADGHYRTIEIVTNDKKALRVRSRRGWYSPTQ
jgi:Ca-activated chloride channel homolog